jgi:hypothetical protein
LGDASDDFKFSSFFPEFLAPVIDTVAFVLGFITRLRHAPEAQAAANSGVKGLHAAGGPSVLGSDTADASRRRYVSKGPWHAAPVTRAVFLGAMT